MTAEPGHSERVCLVTVGATVGFSTLTSVALQPAFWTHLREHHFTSLRIQCGPDIDWASRDLAARRAQIPKGLQIEVFSTRDNLLKEEMVLCRGDHSGRATGLVISHAGEHQQEIPFTVGVGGMLTAAGSGTILDACKADVPLIVVPNTDLLDNHQAEMAKHLAKEGYATQAIPDVDDLAAAMAKSQLLVESKKSCWKPHSVSAVPAESLWTIKPQDVRREENARMAAD